MAILPQNDSKKISAAQQIQSEIDSDIRRNHDLVMENMADSVAVGLMGTLEKLYPPSNNMGGTSPLPPYIFSHSEISWESVAELETIAFLQKQKTKIDWITFTTVAGTEAIHVSLDIIFPGVRIINATVGMKGYSKVRAIVVDDVQFGLIGYGASHGRDSCVLTGVACKTFTHEKILLLHQILGLLDARITRLDICLDFYQGECTWDYANWCYDVGYFQHAKSSVNPERRVYDKNRGKENLGRTLYVGRANGEVMARIYEKGLEVFANMAKDYKVLSDVREAEFLGSTEITFQPDRWLRVEIEYKRKKKDKDLPHMMLLDRDAFFAGAYPFCASVLQVGDGVRPKRLKSEEEISLDKMFKNMRASYGNAVHTFKDIGFSDAEIIERLNTGLPNQKLSKAGVIAAIKNDKSWQDSMTDYVPF